MSTQASRAQQVWKLWALGLCTLLTAGTASAITTPLGDDAILRKIDAGKVGIRTLRPKAINALTESLNTFADGGEARVRVDTRSGAPRLISGAPLMFGASFTGMAESDYVTAARRYVEDHADDLGFGPADMRLNESATLIAKDIQLVSFKITRGGVEIQDANVDFRFKNGQLVQVANKSYGEAQVEDGATEFADLESVVEKSLKPKSLARSRELFRVVPSDRGYTLKKVVEFNALTDEGKLYIVEVEAGSGELFEVRPTEFNFDGVARGEVYERTYYKERATVMPYRDLNINYSGGGITTDEEGRFSGLPNKAEPSLNGFRGKFVNVRTNTGATVKIDGAKDGDEWTLQFTRSSNEDTSADKTMAQSMTFYHLNKEIQHAKKWINPRWFTRPLTANVNLRQSCNAYWDGSTVNLFSAGNGCANTGLIADVFYHEWGHGLHANTSGIDDRAYSEGFSDACALLLTRSNLVGPGFRLANGAPVRDLTTLKVYPKDADTEVHQEGLIIAGAYWDLFSELKKEYGEAKAVEVLSNFVFKAIYTTHAYTDVYDALLTIDSDGGNSLGKSKNFCHINRAFARHGLAEADGSCD